MAWLLKRFLSGIVRNGALEVVTAGGERFVLGDERAAPVAIQFRDRGAENFLMINPELAFGELYMNGQLQMLRGSIDDLIAVVAKNLQRTEPHGLAWAHGGIRKSLRPLHQWNTRRRAQRNVAHHYDLDRQFYELFLDSDRQYSCAYFERQGQSLEDAQRAKKRHIAAKLLLKPGQKVLDIGSGWGGLGLYFAQHCGASVTGVTLSSEQLQVAKERARDLRLADQADFRLQDFRDIREIFDRVVSVGMFEHVGIGYYDRFFCKVRDVLADDGVMLLHSIGRMDKPAATNPWIEKYIFPGGYIPALSEVLGAVERSGLIVTDVEILRLHYAETLKAWRERFNARRKEAERLYDERFCRMWEFYLTGSEYAFRHCGLMVFQIQLTRRQDAVPLTRNYIGSAELALKQGEEQYDVGRVAAE